MTDDAQAIWTRRAARLREAFDRTFVEPADAAPSRGIPVLAVIVAGRAFAIRLRDCAAVIADAPITTVPAQVNGFLGYTSAGGAIRSVYALDAFLAAGRVTAPSGRVDRSNRGASQPLIVAAAQPVAFAVDVIDGQRMAEDAGGAAGTSPVVSIDGIPTALVKLDEIVGLIARETRAFASRGSGPT